MGEIRYKNIFIDGTKIEANANRYTFVWAKAVEKNLQKLKVKINQELPSLCQKYGLVETASLQDLAETLIATRNLFNIKFVYGKGKRKTELQKDYEKIYEYLERLTGYYHHLDILGKRSWFMLMIVKANQKTVMRLLKAITYAKVVRVVLIARNATRVNMITAR